MNPLDNKLICCWKILNNSMDLDDKLIFESLKRDMTKNPPPIVKVQYEGLSGHTYIIKLGDCVRVVDNPEVSWMTPAEHLHKVYTVSNLLTNTANYYFAGFLETSIALCVETLIPMKSLTELPPEQRQKVVDILDI